jgi:hypothetical protein
LLPELGASTAPQRPLPSGFRYAGGSTPQGGRLVNEMYDRQHVDSVLNRIGVPTDRRNAILDEIRFPIDLDALQAFLVAHGITHDGLISRMGGSP